MNFSSYLVELPPQMPNNKHVTLGQINILPQDQSIFFQATNTLSRKKMSGYHCIVGSQVQGPIPSSAVLHTEKLTFQYAPLLS